MLSLMALYWCVQNALAKNATKHSVSVSWWNVPSILGKKTPHHPWSMNIWSIRSFFLYKIDDPTDRGYLIKHLGIETSKVGKTFANHGGCISSGIEKRMGNKCMSRPQHVFPKKENDGTSGRNLVSRRACSVSIPDDNASFTWLDIRDHTGSQSEKCVGFHPCTAIGGKCQMNNHENNRFCNIIKTKHLCCEDQILKKYMYIIHI